MYKTPLFIILMMLLIQPLVLKATEINNPMRPPAFALQKFQQEKNKNNPKVVAVQQNSAKSKALQLTSILYSSTRKVAIIDEQMLSVGDSINGARLISIKKDSAHLVKNGRAINLRLSNQSKGIRKTVVQKSVIQKAAGEKKL